MMLISDHIPGVFRASSSVLCKHNAAKIHKIWNIRHKNSLLAMCCRAGRQDSPQRKRNLPGATDAQISLVRISSSVDSYSLRTASRHHFHSYSILLNLTPDSAEIKRLCKITQNQDFHPSTSFDKFRTLLRMTRLHISV